MRNRKFYLIVGIVILFGCFAALDTPAKHLKGIGKDKVGPMMDNFNDENLGDYWIVGPGENQRNDEFWSLKENKGYLTITTQDSDIHTTTNDPKNFFLRNAPDKDYSFTTKLNISPEQSFEQAGLIVWNGPDDYIRLSSLYNGKNMIEAAIEADGQFSSQQRVNMIGDDIYLRIQKIGRTFTYFVSGDGKDWNKIGFSVKTSYQNEKIGLFAISPGSGRHIPAKFDFFKVQINPQDEEDTDESNYKLPEDSKPVKPETGQKVTPFLNPVFNHDSPDPAVIKADDGYYYAITTQSMYNGELNVLPILRSRDLVNWEHVGEVFSELPDWVSDNPTNIWAPDLVQYNGKYYVYYSAQIKDGDNFGIGVAVADHPLGPYEDKGAMVTGESFTTIDPMVFTDTDGERYMYWGSGHDPIKVQKLSEDGLSLIGTAKEVLYPHSGSVIIKDTEDKPYTENYDRLIEGPWVVKRGDYYYMFYSGDNCCGPNAHYATSVARATSPTGPFTKFEGNPILQQNTAFNAPGHNGFIQDDAGQDWMLYHAMDRDQQNGRVLLIDKIIWKDGWPIINDGKGPSSTLQEDGPIINN